MYKIYYTEPSVIHKKGGTKINCDEWSPFSQGPGSGSGLASGPKKEIPLLMQDTLDSLMQTKVDNDLILSESNPTCPGTLVAVEER